MTRNRINACNRFDRRLSRDIIHCSYILEAGVPIESIAKMMGHASIASTQIYAQITNIKISRDMDRLIGKSGKY